MRKAISVVTSLLLFVVAAHTGRADSSWEFSVQASASVQASPSQIILSWPQDTYMLPNSYTVFRKAPGATSWSNRSQLPGTATSFTDYNVTVGTAYEYQIVKTTSQYTGYGYVYAGINLPPTDSRGKLLLVVDATHAASLSNELARLQQDLVGDGWAVARFDVNRNDSVVSVKNLIKTQYNADPANVKAVFLFGHVPVPYSGDIVPDGHMPDHQGAWPCDGFYGDMDGTWTDSSVNDSAANEARTKNVPGDGKYDQSTFPAPLKLMVGRVDLANMPGRLTWGGPATFPSELDLLRNYLNKDHKFRHKQFDLPRRGIVGDYFGYRNGEAFAASGWRNFSSFFTATNIANLPTQGTWVTTLNTNACLFAYGCGSGSYTSIGGLGNTDVYHDAITTEVMSNDVETVFALLFGSWLGDWDSEDNILRSILALPSYGLASAWSGRPHWFMHHMAMGEPIGFSARLTQNNAAGGLYQNQLNSCAGQIHIALMGDPTLRLHTVAPPTNLQRTPSGNSLNLTWTDSNDSVAGYHVYRASNPNGPFTRLTQSPVTSTSFADSGASGASSYMVRAVKLETSGSGTYYNLSQGAFLGVTGISNGGPADVTGPVVTLTAPAANASISGPSVPIAASASDASGVAGVQFRLDGDNIGAEITAPPYSINWDSTTTADGPHAVSAVGRDSSGNQTISANLIVTISNSIAITPTNNISDPNAVTWMDDSLPAGAVGGADGGDSWNWVSSNPAPVSGKLASQSSLEAGLHQHYFTWASKGMGVNPGDFLFAYVYVDPNNIPSQLMLQWNDGTWEHRAYWGANKITYGADGTDGRRYIGPLPAAGQWVRLQIPAKVVGLEGSTVTGMAFSQFDGRATWDLAGKASVSAGTNQPPVVDTSTPPVVTTNPPPTEDTNTPTVVSTNALPGVNAVDYTTLELPPVGSNTLHVLTPNLLELKLINSKQPDPARVTEWDLIDANNQFQAPAAGAFTVTADGQQVAVAGVGFKRRPIYAPFEMYDLRIENSLYLQLAAPISDNQVIEVKNPSGTLWSSSMKFAAKADPLRYSPAIHVNHEGYMPNHSKKAMVGYYLGSLGEMNVPAPSGFKLVDAVTGAQVYQGSLVQRPDAGYTYNPTPYQLVYEADFTSFNTPGEYRLAVPGMGGSLPFLIDNGIAMSFARAYALGLYHQRCGTNTAMPYTRHTHGVCHSAPASIPWPASSWPFTWTTVSNYGLQMNPDNPAQVAPTINAGSQLFPFAEQGTVDVSGGHHDAGDYSKYTINSASLVHYLMFAADSLQGVAALDNLGLPESGDGISDVMQEAKWEADFLAKLQDSDGGFYFLVYPQNHEYEAGVTPDHGDPQVVWPKNTTVTAASVAALAQCASSPLFKQTYPATAALYLQKAQLGWQFLTNAIARYGKNGAYQKITHYGDTFADQDELAWAACQMYLATGDATIHQRLLSWFDPADPATRRWGWWHLSECYGHAIRSYAFAVQSGRASADQLDATFLGKCRTEIVAAGDDVVNWSKMSAYGTSFPDATKRVKGAGWYFSTDQAFDVAVAQQLNPKTDYITALLANMNYEGGCNPVNVAYVTGMGWKRQRDIVSQWHMVTPQLLPPTGIPVGNVTANFGYLSTYGGMLEALCFPSDSASNAPYPFYDRWGDSWNVTAEMVILNQARSLGTLAFLAAQTPLKTQAWKSEAGQIAVPTSVIPVGAPVTLTMQAAGVDLSAARITWETRDEEPSFGQTFTFSPKNNGSQWVQAEAQLPDGRRVFAVTNFLVNSPNIVWVNDSLPTGAAPGADGGDAWTWVTNNPSPFAGSSANQSALASGAHQHYFDNATAALAIGTGDVLYTYIFLDPLNPPSEVMLQWNDGTWEHRAFWGANNLGYGQDGTTSRRYMGVLPPVGQWVQLKVPAKDVNLEGSSVKGMAFTLYGGRATFDAAGRLSQVSTNTTPNVSLSATGATASRLDLSPGTFTFTRTGDTNTSLSVSYSLGGTAASGLDFQLSPNPMPANTIMFPTGATSVTLGVNPLATTNFVGPKTVVVTLAANSAYQAGTPSTATVAVGGNTIPVQSLTLSTTGAAMQWNSTPDRVYRVAYKNSLSDANWITATGDITATSQTTSWVDNTARNSNQRFYLVAQVR